ncbi:MAG: class I SAM-dependent methyltransferase, partial [Albidovulum sp.]
RALVAEAARQVGAGGPVWVDGQKTDGIESMLKDVRSRVPVSAPLAKAHGKIFRFDAPGTAVFADWLAAETVAAPGFVTLPGVFSADKVDAGSALLASALPANLPGRGADLGAGWGWLSAQVLTQGKVAELHLIEADHAALACARRNVTDARAVFHWADAIAFKPAEKFDFIVTNPPFHNSRAADPGLGAAFIRAAGSLLKPSGVLLMVANRHLPYESVLAEVFRDVAELAKDAGFKVFRAARPEVSPKPIAPPRPRR